MRIKTKKETLKLNFCKLERALFLITPKTKKGQKKVNEMYDLLKELEIIENVRWEDYQKAIYEENEALKNEERINDNNLQPRSIRRIQS